MTAARRSIIVTAPNGCHHAGLALQAVRRQLGAGDELVVVEPHPCAEARSPVERHIDGGSTDDYVLTLRGSREVTGDIVVVLEDHAVIGDHLLDATEVHLATGSMSVATFHMVNGTPSDLGSRLLFAYVAGFATRERSSGFPEPVCSSFAVQRAILDAWHAAVDAGDLSAGDLPTRIVPKLVRRQRRPLPPEMTITHHQSNTVTEALSAIHWNARRAGALDADSFGTLAALLLSTRRYLGRSVLLMGHHWREPSLVVPLTTAGMAGLTGWWLGRWRGSTHTGDRLAAIHPPVR